MIPYGRQNINKTDVSMAVKALKSDWLTQGPRVLEFEKALAKYCGAKYAVAVSNGTAALHLAYLVAALEKGDEVITTPNTFAATSNMLLAVGAKPVFCDISLDNYNINENEIEKLITNKTKAIVPVHFAGQSCAMKKIRNIAHKHKLIVIEDACHALGAKYQDNKVGNCKYSDMAVFSFHAVKPITTGEGGAIMTNNKKYYDKLISLRSHGIYKDKNGKNIMTSLGYNYRLTDFQAALGISQLKKIDFFIKERRNVFKWYEKELSTLKDIILPKEEKDIYSGWHLYVIRVKNKNNRDGLMKYLKQNGIGVNFHYPLVYTHPYYKGIGYKKLSLKCAKEYYNTCVTLPCHTLLSRVEVARIGKLIKKYFIIK